MPDSQLNAPFGLIGKMFASCSRFSLIHLVHLHTDSFAAVYANDAYVGTFLWEGTLKTEHPKTNVAHNIKTH